MGTNYATVSAALAQRVDPTQTTTLREREFRPQLTKRYVGVRGAVRTTIEENDALGITARRESQRQRQNRSGPMWTTAALAADDISPQQSFQARNEAAREEAFLQWFEGALEDGVLEPAEPEAIRNGDHYSAQYIREAYRKGIRDGGSQLREFEEATGNELPEEPPAQGSDAVYAAASAVTLAALYQRTYSAIKGTIQTATRDVRRVFDELYPQASKSQLVSAINETIADGGEDDAVAVAQSEPIYAYAEGQLDQFEAHGVDEVGVEPEVQLSTAGDSAVCSRCRRKARQGPYPISEIRKNPRRLHPPLHPHCRCRLVLI